MGGLPFFSFLFSYASVLNTCISMYIHAIIHMCIITPRLRMRRAGLSNRVRLSVCLCCVCQQKNIEMCPKYTIDGFSCLQRAYGQRKSYLLYVHNASGRSIRLYSLPFHMYRIYWEPLTRSSYYVTTYGTRPICACACAYEIITAE